jgi:hypothetical protein
MQDKYEIFAEKGLTTIFDGALLPNINQTTNEVNNYRVIGYRLESIRTEKVQVICRMPEDSNGVYTAGVVLDGVRRRGKSTSSVFFPKHWTKDEVTDAIFEAYQNRIVKNVADNQYIGKTSKEMHIFLWLDGEDKVTDAMPFRDAVIELNRRLNRRRRASATCGICGQYKHYVCLERHNPRKKQTGFKRILKRSRYYSRKIYYNLAKNLGLLE